MTLWRCVLSSSSVKTFYTVLSDVVPSHAMKAHRGSRGLTPLILDLGTGWRWVVNFTHLLVCPRERTPLGHRYLSNRMSDKVGGGLKLSQLCCGISIIVPNSKSYWNKGKGYSVTCQWNQRGEVEVELNPFSSSALEVGNHRQAPAALSPKEKTWYPLYRRAVGPRRQSAWTRKMSPPLKLDPRTVQPVVSRNTDRLLKWKPYTDIWVKSISLL